MSIISMPVGLGFEFYQMYFVPFGEEKTEPNLEHEPTQTL